MLQEHRRQELGVVVNRMTINGEKEEDIQMVVDGFKSKYANEALTPSTPMFKEQGALSTLDKMAEIGKDIVRDVTKPVIQSIAAPAQLAAYGIDKATGGNAPVEDFAFNMPFWGEIAPAKTNEEAFGRGAKTVAVGAGPVTGGALFMGGQAMEENKGIGEVALNAAGGALLGKAGDLAFKGVGTVLSKTGEGMQTIGAGSAALMKSAMKNFENVLGPTTKQNKRITRQITEELVNREVTATTRQDLWEKAGGQVEKYGEEISAFYKSLPENSKVTTTSTLKAIDALKRKLFVKGEGVYIVPEVNRNLFKKYQDLQIEIMSMSKNGVAPLEGIRALRQAIDKNIAKTTSTFGVTGEESILLEAKKSVANILRNELAKQYPDAAVLNKEFTFWSRVRDVLGDTIERKTGQATPLGEKLMTAAGAAGGAASGGVGSALTMAVGIKYLHKAIQSAAWQTTSAQVKKRLADFLAEGDVAGFNTLLQTLLKGTGVVLEKTGNFLKAAPTVLKEGPRKNIPGTREINLNEKAKTILDKTKGMPMGLSLKDVSGGKAGYEGVKDAYTPGPLTTKLLKKLEGRSTVSKTFISDLTNAPDLKQTEKDVIRQVLQSEGDKVNVADFGKKVESELLPLKVKSSDKYYKDSSGIKMRKRDDGTDVLPARYESISLPDELKGNVEDYSEHIYESPIKTSAGDIHFSGNTKNYFGHTRVEDMAPEWKVGNTTYKNKTEAKIFGDNPVEQPKTRRVIEVQSDLYQKGRLENEIPPKFEGKSGVLSKEKIKEINKGSADRAKEVAKLQQYSNPTAHFRMVREEIKRAADDGVEKLQFPTGETGMKIEGLGSDSTDFYWGTSENFGNHITKNDFKLVKVGNKITGHGNDWIVTDVLSDGKFKAVTKNRYDDVMRGREYGRNGDTENLDNYAESFDISGKVDQNNPIYKFYEKELGRYLKNNFDAKLVTDKQGVSWMEVTVKPGHKGPVTAFGFGTGKAIAAGLGVSTLASGAAVANQKPKTVTVLNPRYYNEDGSKKEETPKEKEVVKTILAKQEDDVVKRLSQWTQGEASTYNPLDPNQTRKGTDGTGAYGRKVERGSIAFGNRYFQDELKSGKKIYIQVEGMEDVKTPYGPGVFRVDDTMNKRYNQKGKFNIDFHPEDFGPERTKKGRFAIKFKIVRID